MTTLAAPVGRLTNHLDLTAPRGHRRDRAHRRAERDARRRTAQYRIRADRRLGHLSAAIAALTVVVGLDAVIGTATGSLPLFSGSGLRLMLILLLLIGVGMVAAALYFYGLAKDTTEGRVQRTRLKEFYAPLDRSAVPTSGPSPATWSGFRPVRAPTAAT